MALYDFAATVRRGIIYLALGIVALIVLMILYRLAVNLYLTLNPPPEPPPTVGFGKLPKLRLPQLTAGGNPTYVLDTPTGALPEFDDRATVLEMVDPAPTLLAEDKARELARKLDFGGQGTLSADRRTLSFQDATDQRTLAVNLTTQNFSLTTAAARIAELAKGTALSGPNAVKEGQELLSSLGLNKFGFETGNQTTGFWASTGSVVTSAGSISEAHFTEVNFYRSLTGIDDRNFPILPLNPKEGMIQVWTTSGLKPEINNTLALVYNAQEVEISRERTETYPLKNVGDAWNEIQAGQGIAYVGTAEDIATIQVTSVTLAYFDDAVHQDYLQPIYVFSGVAKTAANKEVEFVAYSQAVSAEWVEE